jgi:hypothetical protein
VSARADSNARHRLRRFNISLRHAPIYSEALDALCRNARVTMSTLTREKIPREGKKTLASMVQRA